MNIYIYIYIYFFPPNNLVEKIDRVIIQIFSLLIDLCISTGPCREPFGVDGAFLL